MNYVGKFFIVNCYVLKICFVIVNISVKGRDIDFVFSTNVKL